MFAPPPGGAFLNMKFPPLKEAIFLQRENRFVGKVLLNGEEVRAYIRNTGRLTELLRRGNKVYLKEKHQGKYPYEILLVDYMGTLVCIDSHIAPKIYAESLMPKNVVFEPKVNASRFDLLVDDLLIEVKSVNLVVNGVALFPDAPTKRGARHLRELAYLIDSRPACVVFIVQREDALAFAPNCSVDPEFCKAFEEFRRKGGMVKAYRCSVSIEGISLKDEIIVLGGS